MAKNKGIDIRQRFSYPAALAEIKRLQARVVDLEWEVENEWSFNIRQAMDCAAIALHEVYGFGPERNNRFLEAMTKTMVKYMQMSLKEVRETDQGKGCTDFVYTQGVMDRDLRAACGEGVPDWEDRYSEDALAKMLVGMGRLR